MVPVFNRNLLPQLSG